jgi:hypothetical protein
LSYTATQKFIHSKEYVNIHFHILFLDGVYVYHENRPPRFLRVKARDKSAFEQNQGVLILPILRPPAFHGILFSQGANPQPQISKDATEKRLARTVAYYRSGIDGYALCDHLTEQLFRAVGGHVANFSSSVGGSSEKTYCQQAVYLSYT